MPAVDPRDGLWNLPLWTRLIIFIVVPGGVAGVLAAAGVKSWPGWAIGTALVAFAYLFWDPNEGGG